MTAFIYRITILQISQAKMSKSRDKFPICKLERDGITTELKCKQKSVKLPKFFQET